MVKNVSAAGKTIIAFSRWIMSMVMVTLRERNTKITKFTRLPEVRVIPIDIAFFASTVTLEREQMAVFVPIMTRYKKNWHGKNFASQSAIWGEVMLSYPIG